MADLKLQVTSCEPKYLNDVLRNFCDVSRFQIQVKKNVRPRKMEGAIHLFRVPPKPALLAISDRPSQRLKLFFVPRKHHEADLPERISATLHYVTNPTECERDDIVPLILRLRH